MGAGKDKDMAQEQVQVQQVGDLIWGHQGVDRATSASPRNMTLMVQVQLVLGQEAEVDGIVQQWDVQAPGHQVSHNEGGALTGSELDQVDLVVVCPGSCICGFS